MMDRYCEFCVNLRSVVYCKADAAYLCLSCDTKVHSANPLSNRHYRTLICDTCRRCPSYIQCYDHKKFMCHACDLTLHDASSQHRKRFVNSYVGCPSAQDLGVLWGFDLNRFVDGSKGLNHKVGSTSSTSTNASVTGLETNVNIKEVTVLQQLVDLLKIQTYDIDRSSSIIRCQEHKVDDEDDQFSLCLDHQDMSLDPSSSPFIQLDHLESETDETDLKGDSYWRCKSPVLSNQLWSQNMQDLAVCEEPSCLDDLNMPDIDLTFKNFEELFRIEHEPTRIDTVKSIEDNSMPNSPTNAESSPKKAHYASQIMSLSHSRICAESSGTVCLGSGISPSCGSIEHHELVKLNGKKNVDQLKDSKQDQCDYRKARSDTRKRIKSQSWKFESYESVTRC